MKTIIKLDKTTVAAESSDTAALTHFIHFVNKNKIDSGLYSIEYEAEPKDISFKRIDNDTNGNPRYVCHFLEFISKEEASSYPLALARAKKLGGRKFHNKQYGGGIVFQSYNIQELQQQIFDLMKTF